MEPVPTPNASGCEWAELYVLGTLAAEERIAFEAHLAGCPGCQERVQSAAETMAMISRLGNPRPEARSALLAKVRATDARDDSTVFSAAGLVAKRAEKMEWQPSLVPGIWSKTLFADEARGHHTSLVKLDAGAKYPPHRHADVEELFILHGDLHYDNGDLQTGDYCRAEADSVHSTSFTRNGCVLLVTASTSDQILS